MVSAPAIPSFLGFCEFSVAEERRRNYSAGLDNEDGVLGRQKGLLSSTIAVLNFLQRLRFGKKWGRIFHLEGWGCQR